MGGMEGIVEDGLLAVSGSPTGSFLFEQRSMVHSMGGRLFSVVQPFDNYPCLSRVRIVQELHCPVEPKPEVLQVVEGSVEYSRTGGVEMCSRMS